MPFRKKTRNPVSHPEKENEGIATDQPLSPRLIRCKSDGIHRTCSEISLNKSSSNNGALSPETKMSNLMQLNAALVKEITPLRHSHAEARDKVKLESSLREENDKLTLDVSSLQKGASALKDENEALLAAQEELQSSLGTSRAQVEGLSMELAMVKAEDNEALSTQKQALAASEERLSSATCDLIAVKENAALIISEKDSLYEEKEVALRVKADTEGKLDALHKRESELAKLLEVEKKAVTDAQGIITTLSNEVKNLLTEKEALKQKGEARENEATQRMQLLEERLNSLKLQIEEERATHAEAMMAGQENSARKLSELSAEIMAAKEHLQESKNMVETLSMHNKECMNEHQAETRILTEKLIESTQKNRAMEELLQESNVCVEALRRQLVDDSAKHQVKVNSLRQNISAMAVEVNSLSAETHKLQAKKENLHKELSRVNQKHRATSEQLSRERKALAEAQKSEQVLQEEVTQLRFDKERSLKEEDLLKQELSQCYTLKAALLSEKELLFSEKVALEADISSLTENGLKLFNERQNDQRAHAEEMQQLHTELKKLEGTVSDLEIEQSDLLKQLNVEKMAVASAHEKIAALENRKEALLRELFNIKAAYTEQLSSKEREMGSLHDEVQKLCQLNTLLHEQVTCIRLERDNVLVEKHRVVANLMELEVETLELSSAKKALQQALEEERANAQSAMSSLEHEIDYLQQLKDQLTHESLCARNKAEAVAKDNKQFSRDLAFVQSEKAQLELRLTQLSEELVHVRERVEVADTAFAKQHTDMEKLQIEISKLTSANSELMSSIKMHEGEGKLLMLENEKKDEQIAFLSRLSAELEVSHSAMQGEMAKQKAVSEALESDNAVLQSSIEAKAKAILALERQVDDSAKQTVALESKIEAMSSMHSLLELQVKNLQEESIAQRAALTAGKHDFFNLQSTLDERNIKIKSLEEQLAEANTAATHLQDHVKANVDCLMREKNKEIGNLKAQFDEASQKNTCLITNLKTCNGKKSMLEAQFRNIEAELATTKGEVLKAEKELLAAAKWEGEFNEATKRVSLLEAQLTAKATMQNELEFQVISLQNDLQAAHAASAKAEKDWKANMEAMRESANARSRALEEQLEAVKTTLDEMQKGANKGQESIASLQTQLLCLMEEKSSLEKKVSLHPRALQTEKPDHEEKKLQVKPARKSLEEKAKFVRLALPVFLISAATWWLQGYNHT